jgi:cell wall-associated NlpC family hydrolase
MKLNRPLIAAAALCLSALCLAPIASGAAPADDLRTQAAKVQDQIDANGSKISAMAEEFNAAQIRLDNAKAAVASSRAAIAAAESRMKKLQRAINLRAAAIYKDAGLPPVSDEFDPTQPTEFGSRSKYAEIAARTDNQAINELNDVRDQLALQRAQLEEAQKTAEGETAQIESRRRAIESANAEQSRILDQVKGDLAKEVAAEEARRRAEEQRAVQAAINANNANTPAPNNGPGASKRPNADLPMPNVPAPSPRAGAAIAYARAQLGKPYVYAAAGPDSFDCSGLTMRAWGAAGVSMPHYSGSQYAMFPKVPLDQLQPGDLVFRGPGGSQHVGLYIGGGMILHAPQTGDVVKIAPMGSVIGASRPG